MVEQDAPIVEIETQNDVSNAPPEKDLNKLDAATVQNAQNEVDAA
ncbi:MAG: hypothetical protein ABI686_06145 [Acidobacteriota bacterium]